MDGTWLEVDMFIGSVEGDADVLQQGGEGDLPRALGVAGGQGEGGLEQLGRLATSEVVVGSVVPAEQAAVAAGRSGDEAWPGRCRRRTRW